MAGPRATRTTLPRTALRSSYERVRSLGADEQVRECVASQWFRFGYNRTVTEEDRCSIDQLAESFAASGHDVKELLVALTQTNAFLYRRAVQPATDDMGGAQ